MTTTRYSFWMRAGIWVAASQLIAGIALAEDRSGAVVALQKAVALDARQDPCESNRDLDDRSKRDTNCPAVSAGPAFDRAFSATGPAQEVGGGLAGKVVDRFAPPVAAPIDTRSPGQPLAQATGPLLRPCDTPGSGCRNPSPNTTQVVVPPILPGTRPPRTNP